MRQPWPAVGPDPATPVRFRLLSGQLQFMSESRRSDPLASRSARLSHQPIRDEPHCTGPGPLTRLAGCSTGSSNLNTAQVTTNFRVNHDVSHGPRPAGPARTPIRVNHDAMMSVSAASEPAGLAHQPTDRDPQTIHNQSRLEMLR
jgi:hypothetical protein